MLQREALTDSEAIGVARSRARETLLVSLLLLVLLAALFWKPILQGRKLVPADIVYNDPLYFGYVPAELTVLHNVLLYDQAYQFYPWRVFTSQSLRQGYLPFWNPYEYCGVPLLAEDQPAVFYPLNILSYAFPPADAALFTAIARLFVAGLATYWFVRTIGGNMFGALVGAVTFAFSGFMIVFLGHPHTNVVAWLPAFFLSAEWLLHKRDTRNVAWVALAVTCQLTGGHTETALYTLTAGGLYYLLRTTSEAWQGRQWRAAAERLLVFASAVGLGIALASVHLMPFWEWLQHSAEYRLRAGAENLRSWRLGPKYWVAGLVPAVLPNVFGNPTWPGEYRSFFPGWNYVEQTVYVGIIGLALAAAAAILLRRDRRVGFLTILAVVALGGALRVPVLDWVNHLPLFDIASVGRLRLIYTFCAAVLAGLGAQAMLERTRLDSRLRTLGRVLAVTGLLGIPALWAAYRYLLDLAVQALKLPYGRATPPVIQEAYRLSNVSLYWPLLIALAGSGVCWLHGRGQLGQEAVKASLFLLVVLDLFAFGINYHTSVRAEDMYPETPALRQLEADTSLFRVVATNVDFVPNQSILHGLYDIRGLDFPVRRYLQLCQAMGGQDWLGYGILFTEQLSPRLLSLLNVKYELSSSDLSADLLQRTRVAYVDQGIRVYEVLDYQPRAFVVHRVRIGTDEGNALQLVLDPEVDLTAEVVLEKTPPSGFVSSATRASSASARIARYEPNHIAIMTDTEAAGFLVLSDSYYPDWKASVDGIETEIYQADYAFRAVYLPAGQHSVEFAYEPRSFRLASFMSLAALVVTAALAVRLPARFAAWLAQRRVGDDVRQT
jgi:hypothetical protein